MACQHSPDHQTLRLQTGAGEDDVIYLPSSLDRVDCQHQEEEDTTTNKRWEWQETKRLKEEVLGLQKLPDGVQGQRPDGVTGGGKV